MGLIKQLFCNHVFEKQGLINSKRKKNDNIVTSSTFYKCKKCGKYLTVIDNIKVEKDYYIEERK